MLCISVSTHLLYLQVKETGNGDSSEWDFKDTETILHDLADRRVRRFNKGIRSFVTLIAFSPPVWLVGRSIDRSMCFLVFFEFNDDSSSIRIEFHRYIQSTFKSHPSLISIVQRCVLCVVLFAHATELANERTKERKNGFPERQVGRDGIEINTATSMHRESYREAGRPFIMGFRELASNYRPDSYPSGCLLVVVVATTDVDNSWWNIFCSFFSFSKKRGRPIWIM